MSREQAIVALLAETDLFRGLSPGTLTTCATHFREMRFGKGEVLFSRGDPATHLYVVAEGRVRLAIANEEGRELSFRHATEGELFGEIALLDGEPRSAGATALTNGRAYTLERAAFHKQWIGSPEIAANIVHFLCGRLRETSSQLESIALYPMDVRLARFLLFALGDKTAASRTKRVPLELGFSQGELAQLLGASRPKVNAALAELESSGAVGRTLDRLFCDPDKLAAIARLDDA